MEVLVQIFHYDFFVLSSDCKTLVKTPVWRLKNNTHAEYLLLPWSMLPIDYFLISPQLPSFHCHFQSGKISKVMALATLRRSGLPDLIYQPPSKTHLARGEEWKKKDIVFS